MERVNGLARRFGRPARDWLLALAAAALLAGCSPEADRVRGGGLGADPGNTSLPIDLRGNQERNNPSFQVPSVGQAPRDARGVPGWWATREE